MFTALPPFALGLLDQNCTAEARTNFPKLYRNSQNNENFNNKVFWTWIFMALVHSIVLYWLPMLAYGDGVIWGSGKSGDLLVLGNIVYSCTIVAVSYKAALTFDSWNWITHVAVWGSIAFWSVLYPIRLG